jgi:hypothetical protein
MSSHGLERTQPFPPAEAFVFQPLFVLQVPPFSNALLSARSLLNCVAAQRGCVHAA